MTLPPWLWRVLRSRKTRRAGIAGLCLLFAAACGFYPVTNWWGRREFEKAEAEVRARGFPVRAGEISVEEMTGSFFRQPAFLAEAELPPHERLGSCNDMTGRATPWTVAALRMGHFRAISPDRIRADREQLAPYQSRRAGLIAATRHATPLSPGAAWVRIPDEDARLALRLAGFLEEDAMLAKAAGDPIAAVESFEAYFRILTDLLQPGLRHPVYSQLPWEIDRMVTDFVVHAGCQGFDEGQLAKIDGILDEVDFLKLKESHLRELPGECVGIHRDILRKKLPGPRPAGSASSVFSHWDWDPNQIKYRADLAWDLWRPFGIHENRMARGLGKLTDAVAGDETGLRRKIFISRGLYRFVKGSGEVGLFEYYGATAGWKPAEWQAKLVLARHLIAIERHRLRHRAIPGSLEALDADLRRGLPLDPSTAKPLDYSTDGGDRFKLDYATPWNRDGRATWEFPLWK